MTTSTPPCDTLGRPMTDLRISVTDRCNFRCTFCMPAENRYDFLPRPQILTFEEIARLARCFVDLGRAQDPSSPAASRSCGPTSRPWSPSSRSLDGLDDLALTTNALLLPKKAANLAEAGLDRVTVSLHSLDPEIFGRLSGLDIELERVLEGIAAAVREGLGPVKLNSVVIRGTNDHEIVDLAR